MADAKTTPRKPGTHTRISAERMARDGRSKPQWTSAVGRGCFASPNWYHCQDSWDNRAGEIHGVCRLELIQVVFQPQATGNFHF
jgi:hypothetical protein